MIKRVRINSHQLGLQYRAGELHDVLLPGVYWIRLRDQLKVYDRAETRVVDKDLPLLLQNPKLRMQLEVVDLADHERALVYRDGRVAWLLGPGVHAFHKQPYRISVERFDASQLRFEHPRMEQILKAPNAAELLQVIHADPREQVLVWKDGEVFARVTGASFAYWKDIAKVTWQSLDLREQVLDVAGQEIMTKDKVTLRLNLLITYRVLDVETALSAVAAPDQAIHRAAQLALREAVGGRELEQLLQDKEQVTGEIQRSLAARAETLGLEVRGVGIRDVILPGEMKSILNQVIEAQKRAEANLIHRREETAAARSQANTARLLADNPVLFKLKELEMLQEILAGTKATFVLGKGDLRSELRGLVGEVEES